VTDVLRVEMGPPMKRTLDTLDASLLNRIQEQVPLEDRPFLSLARELGTTEGDVCGRLERLKADRVVRQISAIFDSKTLGYVTSLVAAKVAPDRIADAAAIINRHPGVSHNYRRENPYNLWYTIAVPPDSKLGLERTVDVLHLQSGAIQTRLMPTLRMFKIGVKFTVGGGEGNAEGTRRGPAPPSSTRPAFTDADRAEAAGFVATERDKRMIRVLQRDLPIIPRPFDAWAEEAGVDVAELLDAARQYERRKAMRRFSAVLHHREAGFDANAMGVWKVPPARVEAFGQQAATFSAVSHCYQRPTYEDWPYNCFTMVHATSGEECERVLKEISAATGVTEYGALYSTVEYKKVRVQYFTPEIGDWEKGVIT
jgi:DNA-binding Lrp family transcriptional regulator